MLRAEGSGRGLQGEGRWGLGSIQVAIQVDEGFIGVCRRATVSLLEENKWRLIGAKIRKKNLSVHELRDDLLKEKFGETAWFERSMFFCRRAPLSMKKLSSSPGIAFRS